MPSYALKILKQHAEVSKTLCPLQECFSTWQTVGLCPGETRGCSQAAASVQNIVACERELTSTVSLTQELRSQIRDSRSSTTSPPSGIGLIHAGPY